MLLMMIVAATCENNVKNCDCNKKNFRVAATQETAQCTTYFFVDIFFKGDNLS